MPVTSVMDRGDRSRERWVVDRRTSEEQRQTADDRLSTPDAGAARSLWAFVTPWDLPERGGSAPKTGDRYSDAVHQASALAGAGVIGLGIYAAAALGPIAAGIAGFVLATGVAGDVVGAVRDGVEALGKWLAGVFGIDFSESGKTPDGGTWKETTHPDGSRDRTEKGKDGSETHSHWGADGSFHETYNDPNSGYSSDYQSDGKGNTSFHAQDASGGSHSITTTADGTYSTSDRDASADNATIHVSDKDGNGYTYSRSTDADGNMTVTESTKDGASGYTTTTTTTYDSDGNQTSQSTKTTDEDGNDVPPPEPADERPSDEGTDEGPRFGPGQLGKPRPGHPDDVVVGGGGSGGDDDWGETPVRFRDAMRGIAKLMIPTKDTDDRDSTTQTEDEIRRKLSTIEVSATPSGEDYINPKARATLINRIVAALVAGRRLRGLAQ